jgi:hypothetical protein
MMRGSTLGPAFDLSRNNEESYAQICANGADISGYWGGN